MTRPVGWFSGPNIVAQFKPMQKRPSFRKLLSYGTEVNDGFDKAAKATTDSRRLTLLPARIKSKLEN